MLSMPRILQTSEQLQSIWTDIWEHQDLSDLAVASRVTFDGKAAVMQGKSYWLLSPECAAWSVTSLHCMVARY